MTYPAEDPSVRRVGVGYLRRSFELITLVCGFEVGVPNSTFEVIYKTSRLPQR